MSVVCSFLIGNFISVSFLYNYLRLNTARPADHPPLHYIITDLRLTTRKVDHQVERLIDNFTIPVVTSAALQSSYCVPATWVIKYIRETWPYCREFLWNAITDLWIIQNIRNSSKVLTRNEVKVKMKRLLNFFYSKIMTSSILPSPFSNFKSWSNFCQIWLLLSIPGL